MFDYLFKEDPKRVLVVDDYEPFCYLVSRFLKDLNCVPVVALDPREGLLKVEREEFDLVLLDLSMPGMTGFEWLDQAQKRKPGLHVVVVTGFASFEARKILEQKGVFMVLEKPVSLESLAPALSTILDKSYVTRYVERIKSVSLRQPAPA